MLTLSLKNVCKDYHLLIDDQETFFEIDSKMNGNYTGTLTEGTHKIQIYKKATNESVEQGCLLFWLSSLAYSYDHNVISARRSHINVNIVIEINIKNKEQKMIFDTYTNEVLNCSEEYNVLVKKFAKIKKKARK